VAEESRISMEDIGAYLRNERERQHLTLEAVSEHTRISVKMLRAIENGHFEEIGTALLIRSFLRNYCRALGLDPEPVLEKCGSDIQRYDNPEERLVRHRRWIAGPKTRRSLMPYTMVTIVLLVLAAVAGAIWFPTWKEKVSRFTQPEQPAIYPQQELPADLAAREDGTLTEEVEAPDEEKPSRSDRPEGEVPASAVETVEPETVSTSAETAGEGVEPRMSGDDVVTLEEVRPPLEALDRLARDEGPKVLSPTGHRIRLEVVEDTWVQIQVDGVTKESRILKPGETRQWDVQENVRLWVGNGGGIRVTWDGQDLGPLGKRGAVIRVLLPDDIPNLPAAESG